MKVGIDARLWDETGVGRYIRNLVKYLQVVDRTNEYILFIRAADWDNVMSQLTNPKWKIIIADIRWHSLSEQIHFPSILYKEKLDLMHFPYFSYPFLYRKKFVITVHDLILHHFPTGKASTLPGVYYQGKLLGYKFLMRNAVARAKNIIAVSQATKKEIIDHYGTAADKIIVTYEGVDEQMEIKRNALSSLEHKKPGYPYFLYVGNAYPHKNLERLIEAFRIFRKKTPADVRLILVGKDDYFYKRLERAIGKWDLLSSITVLHDIDDEELGILYKNALATIVPSLMEGFGLPALEAMNQKCVVVASDIPSVREVCGQSAIYFEPENTKSIAEKLLLVYKNRNDFSEEKEAGIQRAKEFSWKRMAKQTKEVYEGSISIR